MAIELPRGIRVRLLPLEDEPEQTGTVTGLSRLGGLTYIVELDPEFGEGPWDDGLREVTPEQLQVLKGGE